LTRTGSKNAGLTGPHDVTHDLLISYDRLASRTSRTLTMRLSAENGF
jgi:hypothetical protein